MRNPFDKENRGRLQQRMEGDIDPLVFVDHDKKVIDPLIMIKDHPDDVDHFAILKTTENGRYVVDGMLHFKIGNGATIITELNNVIFVDRIQKIYFIKNYERVTEEIQPKDPEQRQYIIMYTSPDPEFDEEIHRWEAMTGRTATYEWIRDNIEDKDIDPENSYVLVETVPYKDALTITQFIKYLQNADIVDREEFDIDDYVFE